MASPTDDVRQHERDWLKLATLVAIAAMCVGFWIGVGLRHHGGGSMTQRNESDSPMVKLVDDVRRGFAAAKMCLICGEYGELGATGWSYEQLGSASYHRCPACTALGRTIGGER